MSYLFNRTVKVSLIGQPSGFVGDNPTFFETIGNAVEITAMRVEFEVSKSLGKEPNKCVIKLTNLNSHSRSEFEKSPLKCILQAGYDGNARLLFTGDVTQAYSRREGTEIITYLKVKDGFRAFAHGRVNRSYKPPIQVKRVLEDCAKSMGLTLPRDIEQSPELRQALATGISAKGATRDVLTRLLAPYGYNWSVQNGVLQILKDEQVKGGQAHLVNQAAGLINTPEKTTPEKPKQKTEIKFDTLLWPELNPGELAKLESEFLDASLKITEVKHVGDSYDTGEYKTSVNGKPL